MESSPSAISPNERRLAACRPWEAEILASFRAIDAAAELASAPRYRQIYAILHLALSRSPAPLRRLPHERLLAAHFGAARVTIRKALGVLAAEGRLVRTCGRGTFVIDIAPVSNQAA